jgi:hypothetical protein
MAARAHWALVAGLAIGLVLALRRVRGTNQQVEALRRHELELLGRMEDASRFPPHERAPQPVHEPPTPAPLGGAPADWEGAIPPRDS